MTDFTKEQLEGIANGSVYQSEADKTIDIKRNLAVCILTVMGERDTYKMLYEEERAARADALAAGIKMMKERDEARAESSKARVALADMKLQQVEIELQRDEALRERNIQPKNR